MRKFEDIECELELEYKNGHTFFLFSCGLSLCLAIMAFSESRPILGSLCILYSIISGVVSIFTFLRIYNLETELILARPENMEETDPKRN